MSGFLRGASGFLRGAQVVAEGARPAIVAGESLIKEAEIALRGLEPAVAGGEVGVDVIAEAIEGFRGKGLSESSIERILTFEYGYGSIEDIRAARSGEAGRMFNFEAKGAEQAAEKLSLERRAIQVVEEEKAKEAAQQAKQLANQAEEAYRRNLDAMLGGDANIPRIEEKSAGELMNYSNSWNPITQAQNAYQGVQNGIQGVRETAQSAQQAVQNLNSTIANAYATGKTVIKYGGAAVVGYEGVKFAANASENVYKITHPSGN